MATNVAKTSVNVRSLNVTVKLTGVKRFRIGVLLIRLGAWLCGASFNFESNDKSPRDCC